MNRKAPSDATEDLEEDCERPRMNKKSEQRDKKRTRTAQGICNTDENSRVNKPAVPVGLVHRILEYIQKGRNHYVDTVRLHRVFQACKTGLVLFIAGRTRPLIRSV